MEPIESRPATWADITERFAQWSEPEDLTDWDSAPPKFRTWQELIDYKIRVTAPRGGISNPKGSVTKS